MGKSFNIICGISGIATGYTKELQELECHFDDKSIVIIVLDVPRGFAIDALSSNKYNDNRLIVISWSFCPEYLDDLWDLKPLTMIAGDSLIIEVASAIDAAHQNSGYRKTPAGVSTQLSLNERRVLRLLAFGQTNKEISDKTHLSLQTVKNTVATIYHKISVRDRSEALLYYWNIWQKTSCD